MVEDLGTLLGTVRQRVNQAPTSRRLGRVTGMTGLIIESEGPNVGLGDLCRIRSERESFSVIAEVVGFRGEHVLLMPLGETDGLHAGSEVVAFDRPTVPEASPRLLGRIFDALGHPIDGFGAVPNSETRGVIGNPPHPLRRGRVQMPFETGIRSIDTMIPLGRGQRVGLFAGSGVGKSTLLGMIAKGAQADVVVIGLVGERGREVREFVEESLGEAGMRRSVVVVATSDAPAPLRRRAALTATTLAEGYRDQGLNVLLLMDSVTRFAMAQREIGLAVGEPPTTRGYTPSVFAHLPRLLERSGTGESGSITAIYTVLVEGDDMNEPVADSVRGILDGHIVLSRRLAHANHYPAIDVLESVSRLQNALWDSGQKADACRARELLAVYRHNEDLINIGAYQAGTNEELDDSVGRHPGLVQFLRQDVDESVERLVAFEALKGVVR